MEFAELVRRRRMVRCYDSTTPVPEDDLAAIVRAAVRAPTAGFSQGVSLLVLSSPADRDLFWSLTARSAEPTAWLTGMRSAPALLLVWTSRQAYLERYAEPDKGWLPPEHDPGREELSGADQRWSAPYWFVDAGMAAMSALFSAVDHKLGACFFGVPPARVQAVRDGFGVPSEQILVGAITLGYPDSSAGPSGSPTRRRRRQESALVHRGRWSASAGSGFGEIP